MTISLKKQLGNQAVLLGCIEGTLKRARKKEK